MPLQLLFPSGSLAHEDAPVNASSSPASTDPPVTQPSRTEWLIASVIAVVALILVLLFIGPPHVL